MARLHQHPEGSVIVDDDRLDPYVDTLENFEADFNVRLPDFPPDADERIYEPGLRHAFYSQRFGVIAGDVMPWPLGDQIIARCLQGANKQKARQPPPPPPPPEPVTAAEKYDFRFKNDPFLVTAILGLMNDLRENAGAAKMNKDEFKSWLIGKLNESDQ